jgi:hypothetical protein
MTNRIRDKKTAQGISFDVAAGKVFCELYNRRLRKDKQLTVTHEERSLELVEDEAAE